MHKIKKYANRKMYDTTDKKYISMDQVAELVRSGETVSVIDNKTGDDLTGLIISQLLAHTKKNSPSPVPTGVLIQLLRKGGGTLTDYAKKYASLWQNAMTMAEDELDKLVGLLIKDQEITRREGSKLKREILGYTDNLKTWIGSRIDNRINEVLGLMNLVTNEQAETLTEEIGILSKKIHRLEKKMAEKTGHSEAESGN